MKGSSSSLFKIDCRGFEDKTMKRITTRFRDTKTSRSIDTGHSLFRVRPFVMLPTPRNDMTTKQFSLTSLQASINCNIIIVPNYAMHFDTW